MQLSLPYRFLLTGLLAACLFFALGPWLTMRSLGAAALDNDMDRWRELVRPEDLESYAGKMLDALLDLRMYAEMENDPREAMRDNLAGKQQVAKTASEFAGPQDLKHLLCGDLSGDPHGAAEGQGDCWALEGSVHWRSPTEARLRFTNPETHWQSDLILQRTGLFQWRAVAVDLPVDAILERFASAVGLPVKDSI